jgi:hypothetical protein
MFGISLRRSVSILLLLIGVSGSVAAQVSNPALRDELLAMEKIDQDERRKCNAGDADFQMKCLADIAKTIDTPNTERLEKVFDEHGFPSVEMVGRDGQNAFMVVLQHTIGDRLRLKAVKPITRAFKRKELTSQEYANFIDRLRLHQGKGQLYGSGFEFKDGKMVLSKTDDLKNLEKRRRKIGLPPMSEAVKMMKDIYKLEVEMPKTN